ncbi:tetratricopeptide repeat protein [Acidobacteriota bacterium]
MKHRYLLISLLFISVLLHSCAPSKRIAVTSQQLENHKAAIAQADLLFLQGSYLSLKRANEIYKNQIDFPAVSAIDKKKFLKTSILLALRQFELGIVGRDYLDEAEQRVSVDTTLSEYALYTRAVRSILDYTVGMSKSDAIEESQLSRYLDWIKDNASGLNEKMKKSAPYDVFFAYLYIAVNEYLSYWIEDKPNYESLKSIFTDYPLIQFKLSIFPEVDQTGLEQLITKVPDFWEAYQFLGHIELMQGKTLAAERLFLQAYSQIPNSTAIILSLTRIYFLLEEYDRCLEFNEKVLNLTPSNRDALLGKAISLSILGRNEAAKTACRKLIELGKYYIGEAYYWLGWNENELKNFEGAWENVEKAKNYLIGHHELHFLSGIISFEMNDLKRSDTEFREALKLNPGYCDANYYIGSIYAKKESWKESGDSYEASSRCSNSQESAIRNKIEEIENSDFSKDRKAKHINRRKVQLVTIRLSRATAAYNAAASFHNADLKQKALVMAKEAAKHPNFKKQSEELIERIKLLK